MDVDQTILEVFVVESKEHLDLIEESLLALEKSSQGGDKDLINKIFKNLHTIKGSGILLGFQNLGNLVHAMETVLSAISLMEDLNGDLNEDSSEVKSKRSFIEALLEGVDSIEKMLVDVVNSEKVDTSACINNFNKLLEDKQIEVEPSDSMGKTKDNTKKITISKDSKDSKRIDSGSIDLHRRRTVRVKVDILDRLMVLSKELASIRDQHLKLVNSSESNKSGDKSTSGKLSGDKFKDLAIQVKKVSTRLDNVTDDLEATIKNARMQFLGDLFKKFPRMVRQMARDLNKLIDITTSGDELELDRAIIETLSDPLVHIIRNCCDHGIEDREQRRKAGKNERGQILLEAFLDEGQINVSVKDDGRGIDFEKIKQRALQKELFNKEQLEQMAPKELIKLLYEPGFSTTEKINTMSGRGIGMDVVKANIENQGGKIEITSGAGVGTEVLLRLPLAY